MMTTTTASKFRAAAAALAAGMAGSAPAADDAPDKTKLIEIGQQHYAVCMACHGPDGKGLQAGPIKMAPSLVGSKFAVGDPELAAVIVLKGIQKETAEYLQMMAPLGAALDDEKLAGILTYVRSSFGNEAEPITPDQVAAAREKYKDTTGPLKRADLDKMLAESEAKAAEESAKTE